MHLLPILTVFSALACAACAGLMCAQWGTRRPSFRTPLALAALAWWCSWHAFSQADPDPERAIWFARASSPGWIFIGPLALGIFMRAAGRVEPHWRNVQRALTWAGAGCVVLGMTTPWLIESLEVTHWGYALVPGPLFPLASGIGASGAILGVRLGRRAAARSTPTERRGQRWIIAAICTPIAIVGINDAVLPMLGLQSAMVGPVFFGPLAAVVLWLRVHLGYSPLTPGQVAGAEILGILPDGVALVGEDGRIRLANEGLARLCEASPLDLEGLPVARVLQWDGDADSSQEQNARLFGLNGDTLPVAVRSAPYQDDPEHAKGRVLVVRDLREVAELRGQLAISARLAAVGELAAGIAHEINNPLAFVRANLSQLESRWKDLQPLVEAADEPELRERLGDCDELIEESLEGVDRAAETVRVVRNFAHAGSSERELCDLHPLLDEVLKVASTQLLGRVNVIREFDGSLRSVMGSPQQLKQVFLNLVVNAAQSVGPDGTVLVATRREDSAAVVSIADDGCGIPREHLDRLFDPFFTTKPVGEGTGLGLGISHQIVTRHGGEIEVESEEGRGTVFRVRLPALENAA